MQFDAQFLVLAGVVLLAFATEAATGFGGAIIAITLGVRLYSMHRLLPILVPLNLVLSSYIVWRHHALAARRLLLDQILPLMGVGLVVGVVLFQDLSARALKTVFGAFVVGVAVHGLVSRRKVGQAPQSPLSPVARTTGLLAAGLVHGIFASGGPLLVYVLSRANLDKRSFRSTLATVWLVLNLALTVVYILTARLDRTALPFITVLVPAVLLSIAAGEWAHHRLNEEHFRVAVLVLLVVAGLTIVF
jgi:uncharacterized membrane protein YfcA